MLLIGRSRTHFLKGYYTYSVKFISKDTYSYYRTGTWKTTDSIAMSVQLCY
jgi:hypothetical protein